MFANEKVSVGSRLGFIGLGYLGSRIARRLLSAGFPMVVCDAVHAKAMEFVEAGAEIASSPAKLAAQVDVVLSCLPDENSVQSVYLGKNSIFRNARPGTRIIELSTISLETARRLHKLAHEFDLDALDVTVSGSVPTAEAGTLTLFGGGDREVFESAEPIFTAIARQWFYMGPGGSGIAMKLVVNTLLGVGMQAIAEAAALGEGLQLPRNLLFEVLAKTAVVAPAHAGKLATATAHDYAPQFPVRLMRKDFGLILAAAADLHLAMPATEAAAVVNDAEASRGREEDFSAVIRRMEQDGGLEDLRSAVQ
ncbi:MAG: 3-hydroxyisobutyrate dehydrogenase [Bryobacterales bacterium]|nr:3-hydroxyisobutyrate dehydrogenase [Bryobacterales bacterium]